MTMTIVNNPVITKSLGELNKNINRMGKVLACAASGMKINGASDDASGYSISEKMQVQLRALEQDIQNTKTGKNLLNVAAGGIDSIVHELRSLKELAINAANDHNTDIDRLTIQKEFDQRMEDINDIASTTNYNGRLLLNGDYERWRRVLAPDSIVGPGSSTVSTGVMEPNDPPTIISSGPYTISSAGVYVLGPGFTGEINIANNLVGVKIKQATSSTLYNVFINGPTNGNANLWIEGLNIQNSTDKSWIKFSNSNNVLSIKGSNTFSYYPNTTVMNALIHTGDELTLEGSGSLEMCIGDPRGAIIGTNANEITNSNITINSGNYILTAAYSRATPVGGGAGAMIGSGWNGQIGDITVNGGDFDILTCGGGSNLGAGNGGTTGNITMRNANFVGVTDDGACIGSGGFNSKVGNISIENCFINVQSKPVTPGYTEAATTNAGGGAGIGSGFAWNKGFCDTGDINIKNSTVYASSTKGAGIGSGQKSHAGNIYIENMQGEITSKKGEAIGKGLDGTVGDIIINEGEITYTETITLGKPLVIHTGPRANQALYCYIPNMHTKNMGLDDVSVTTRQQAVDSLAKLDEAINYALDAATDMGAYIQELDATEDTLTINSQNTQASESTIRDADMAKTTLEYAKANILSQTSQTVLAQANQTPASVLSLLS